MSTTNLGGIVMGTAKKMIVCLGACFSGMIVVPMLSILSIVFTLVGIGVFAVPVLNLLGIVRIPYYILTFTVIGLPQILVGLIVGNMLVIAGVVCGMFLVRYFKCVGYVFSCMRQQEL